MAMAPADILRISEPVEAIYERTVDELLINIARHFTVSGWERTRYWEIKKLSEMGALTEESARIIAQNTGKLPEEIEAAFLQVSERACLDIDPQLRGAASKGLLQDPGTDATTSPLIRSTVQAYVDEAVDKANMVNTTLLQSTRQAYLQGVTTAVAEAQLLEAQAILDTQTLAVSIGMETRTRAIRKAMEQMSAAGLTGFVDRSGRNWSPEAYAAMVVRTASHNVYVRSIKDRQAEFGGGDIFQVSSHPGARPLCYPYQGKFYSWSAGPGEFTDGGGIRRPYDNINNTSYGQPAGLFGINCGHHPIPMIPGYSYPQEYEEQTKEENDKEYEESQIQRQYERNIRIAKRDREIAAATGDKEAEKKAAQKVQQEQAKMRGFIKDTGRVRRYDREQIGMGDVAPKLVKPVKVAPKPKPTRVSNFVEAADIASAERFAGRFTDTTQWAATGVSYKGVDLEVANRINRRLSDFYDTYEVEKFGGIIAPTGNSREGKMLADATAAYHPVRNSFMLNRKALKSVKTAEQALQAERAAVTDVLEHPEKYNLDAMSSRVRRVIEASRVSGRGTVPDTIESVIDHELGHSLEKQLKKVPNYAELQARMGQYAEKISGYATESWSEYVAESFASYNKKEGIIDPLMAQAFESLERPM